jgi:hypothetical protein
MSNIPVEFSTGTSFFKLIAWIFSDIMISNISSRSVMHKTISVEGISLETVARDATFQIFQLRFQRVLH